ncbi:MAG: flagellar filament capping protein FliD [Lachnospiraceae bacterium]|jgi:flagellar hook-associated protein 2|nr:flagellar filament capping protein FliD [Lachnospiraceae bacterium]
MAMRITGMNSGLDTEAIIAEMVSGQKNKVDTAKKSQISLQWKQDAWKALNTKALSLFNGVLNNMRFTDAYSKKVTNVSNSSAVSVVTGAKAVNGVQELEVKQLAKAGYLTGAELSGGSFTSKSTLKDLSGGTIAAGESVRFSVNTGGKTTDIELTGDSKISDIVSKLQGAGVNANFDEANQRFFISSKTTGEAADFALTANNQKGFDALSAMGVNYFDGATEDYYNTLAGWDINSGDGKAWIDAELAKQVKAAEDKRTAVNKELTNARTRLADAESALNAKGYTDTSKGALEAEFTTLTDEKTALTTELKGIPADDVATDEQKQRRADINSRLTVVNENLAAVDTYRKESDFIAEGEALATELDDKLLNGGAAIRTALETDLQGRIDMAAGMSTAMPGLSAATKIDGQDAKIVLNGAEFTSKSDSFAINGLTITVNEETSEVIKLNTQDDTEGIYDMIKGFMKEYNALINEMDKLYNAASSTGYQPLTSEEKDAMTDDEIADWEKKIKDGLLRRDSTLQLVSGTMKEVMMGAVEVGDKKLFLTNFGIETLEYFTSSDNEKGAYHIDGDADDSFTKNNTDKLKGMIAADPDTVTKFFAGLSKNLYGAMDELMKAGDPNDSSLTSFFDDKKMKRDYESFTGRISELEAKMIEAEDRYYKQFSAMEVALAKMQSNSSAVTGLLGG